MIRVPKIIYPKKIADQNVSYAGLLITKDMQRIRKSVISVDDEADLTVKVSKNFEGNIVVDLKSTLRVELECQRCLTNFHFKIDINDSFFVTNKNKNEFDCLELNEFGELNLVKLVEDEAILNLPQHAKHELDDCLIKNDLHSFGDLPPETEMEINENPFDILKQLK